jgi:hypothetical protein
MKLLVKPRPNEKYFQLSPKDATQVAWAAAKNYGIDGPDWSVFREFTGEYNARRKQRGTQPALI